MSWRARAFPTPRRQELLNENFVSIKVDREERPEIDQIYMRALHALGEQGGWPLTMFLTPDADPFWGGTYFPPEPRWGRPSFRQILGAVSAAWTAQDEAVTKNAAALREHLNRPVIAATGGSPDARLLDQAAGTILSIWDRERGSFQGAPKFPNPLVLDVLWRAFRRNGDIEVPRRRSEDAHLPLPRRHLRPRRWRLRPLFGRRRNGSSRTSRRCSTTTGSSSRCSPTPIMRRCGHCSASESTKRSVGCCARCRHPGGGFASSQDADTEHEEGLTYVWSVHELQTVLGSDFDMFLKVYGVTDRGNWEGTTS